MGEECSYDNGICIDGHYLQNLCGEVGLSFTLLKLCYLPDILVKKAVAIPGSVVKGTRFNEPKVVS